MKKERIIIIVLCTLLIIILGLWLYPQFVQDDEEINVDYPESQDESKHEIEDHEIIPREKVQSNAIAQLVFSSDELYLESCKGSDNLIYLTNEDKDKLNEFIRAMELEFDESLRMDGYLFDFILHLKNNNIGIYIGEAYIFVQDDHGYAGYRIVQASDSLLDQLEQTYLGYINRYIQGMELEEMRIDVKDVQQSYLANEEDVQSIIAMIGVTDIVDNETMAEIPVEYPYYQIAIETGKSDTTLTLVNDHVVLVNMLGEDAYFEYNADLKDLIISYFEWDEILEEDSYYQFYDVNSITIKDSDIEFTMENDEFVCLELIRAITYANKDLAFRMDIDQSERVELQFNFENSTSEIIIYDDYIQFEDNIYKTVLIGDQITEILNTVAIE